jgi:hypothetical protein
MRWYDKLKILRTGPWATDTQLFAGVHAKWIRNDMPINTPLDVAKYTIQVTADPQANGKALYITGGNAFDIEAGLRETQPQWLGPKNSQELEQGQVILGVVSSMPYPNPVNPNSMLRILT